MQVYFQDHASSEYRAVRAWYEDHDLEVSRRFTDAVDAAVTRIQSEPTAHPVESTTFHWSRVIRFPYRLIYEVTASGDILIVAVAHARRRTRHWRRGK